MVAPTPDRSLRAFLTLALPIVIARATQAVVGFTDALMTAPLGRDSFTAVTAGAMNTMNLVIFPMGVVFLVQSFAAQMQGQGNAPHARRYAIYGLGFALVVQVLTVLLLPWIGTALRWFEYEDGVRGHMADYLQWRLAGIGAIVGTEVLGNYRGGLGDTRAPMVANLIAMVGNIGLNALFIYGYWGMPAMGVRGAALASALASGIGFLYLVWVFQREPVTREERGPLRWHEVWRLARFGVPNGLNWFLEFAAFSFFINITVARLGTEAVGALMAVINVNSLSFMPAFGCASAGAIVVGQAIGGGRHSEVPGLVRRTAMVTAVWQGFVGLVYFLFPARVMSAFGMSENAPADVLKLAAALLPLSAAWQLFDALAMTLSEALRAAGDTVWTLWARIVVAWAFFVPGSWYWIHHSAGGGAAAVWSIVGYVAALAGVFLWRFRGGAWRRIELTGEAHA